MKKMLLVPGFPVMMKKRNPPPTKQGSAVPPLRFGGGTGGHPLADIMMGFTA